MPYKLTVNLPSVPEGRDVYIAGLGTFPNGGTYDISDEQDLAYQNAHTRDEGHFDFDHVAERAEPGTGGSGAYVHKLVPGPSIVEAVQSMRGVTLEEVKPEEPGIVVNVTPQDQGGED